MMIQRHPASIIYSLTNHSCSKLSIQSNDAAASGASDDVEPRHASSSSNDAAVAMAALMEAVLIWMPACRFLQVSSRHAAKLVVLY